LPIVREVFGLAQLDSTGLSEAEGQTLIPPAELVTAIIAPDTIHQQLSGRSRTQGDPATAAVRPDGPGQASIHLAPWLLLAGILIFILESALARRAIASS
jgi:hypothetical protein